MKSAEALQNALRIKEKELEAQRTKVADLDAWIAANNVFGTEQPATFLEKLLTEKVAALHRLTQLEEQVKIIKWILQ